MTSSSGALMSNCPSTSRIAAPKSLPVRQATSAAAMASRNSSALDPPQAVSSSIPPGRAPWITPSASNSTQSSSTAAQPTLYFPLLAHRAVFDCSLRSLRCSLGCRRLRRSWRTEKRCSTISSCRTAARTSPNPPTSSSTRERKACSLAPPPSVGARFPTLGEGRCSYQILAQVTLQVLAVTLRTDEAGIVDQQSAAGHHPVHMAVDLKPLPGGVVHVHVVRLLITSRGMARRVIDHQIGIGTWLNHAFFALETEHQRRSCGGQLDPPGQRDPASDPPLVHQIHAVLDSPDAIGNRPEIIEPELFLFLHAERAVIGGDDLQVVGPQRLPHSVLMTLGDGPQRCGTHPLGAHEARGAKLIFQGEIEVLRTGFAEDVLTPVTRRSQVRY